MIDITDLTEYNNMMAEYDISVALPITNARRKQAEEAVWEEYKQCRALEKTRMKCFPLLKRRVFKKKAYAIIKRLCERFDVPSIDDISLGVGTSERAGCVATYAIHLTSGKTRLSVNGILTYPIKEIVHELAHHIAVCKHNTIRHSTKFVECETEVFDTILKMIKEKKI